VLRKILKVLGYFLLFLVVVILGALAVFFIRYPRVEAPPQIHIVSSPEKIAQGEYLAKHVTGCVVCHGTRSPRVYSHSVVPGTEGRGGLFLNVPGVTIYTPNITPHALSSWSDGEIARAIISGVNKQGNALFPIMPYPYFALLTEDDLTAVIAYIRSLTPIDYDPPRTRLGFPLNLIVRTMPKPAEIRRDPVTNRGFYLTRISSCIECHTPKDSNHKPLPGMDFAGGEQFENGVQSANITPDPETGIGKWSKSNFISQFKRFDSAAARNILLAEGTQNTPMPWTAFAGMKEEDLSAIYDYLRTIPPVRHAVQRFHSAN
jgi:mono/diheme cytochrome c family protein